MRSSTTSQGVAEDRRPVELRHQRAGELGERVRQQDDLGAGAQIVEELDGTRQRLAGHR